MAEALTILVQLALVTVAVAVAAAMVAEALEHRVPAVGRRRHILHRHRALERKTTGAPSPVPARVRGRQRVA